MSKLVALDREDKLLALVAWAFPAGPVPSIAVLFTQRERRGSLAFRSAAVALVVWLLSAACWVIAVVAVFVLDGPTALLVLMGVPLVAMVVAGVVLATASVPATRGVQADGADPGKRADTST